MARDARDGEAQVCGREEMREDGVLGVWQAVRDVKGGSTVRNWQQRISGGTREKASTTGLAAGAMGYTAFFPYVG